MEKTITDNYPAFRSGMFREVSAEIDLGTWQWFQDEAARVHCVAV